MSHTLLEAIKNDDIKEVRLFINKYRIPDEALNLALETGKITIMRMFLNDGNLNKNKIYDLLRSAILAKDFNMAELILKYDVLTEEDFYVMKDSDDLEIFRFYLDHISPEVKKSEDMSKLLNSALWSAINDYNDYNAPQWKQTEGYDPDLIQILLQYGAKPYTILDSDNKIVVAIKNDDTEFIELFLDYFSPDDLYNLFGKSIEYNKHDMVKLFLDYGVNPDHIIPYKNTTPLKTAVNTDNLIIIQLLLDYGANINSENLLIQAVERGNIKIIKFLLDNGANPNNKDLFGNTTLQYAGSKEIIELLIDYGANKNLTNWGGHTPAQFRRTGNQYDKMLADFIDSYEPLPIIKKARS